MFVLSILGLLLKIDRCVFALSILGLLSKFDQPYSILALALLTMLAR